MNGEIVIRSKEGVGTIVEFTTLMKSSSSDLNRGVHKSVQKDERSNEFEKISTKDGKINNLVNQEKTDLSDKSKASNFIVGDFIDSSNFTEKLDPNIKRILLVEDNPISQKVELKLLKENGYNVSAVSNGYDAVEAVKTSGFNLVLMDVEMAGIDGLEATRRIRDLEKPISKIPIIAVTAHSSMKDREKCLAAGMDDYIAKPININFMKITIDHWLGKKMVN